ncbi:hypothetical protein [Aeromonas sp. FDAARGOS 1402]|uniref:hypothetical protein n=1 Tax=Aeromonas sp. FDAARGOS 1402 TaxID=2778051 RepID=UPI0020B28366|nr:hypothetical protein [Aeromonas sp. FDAARGOS 1402]
MSTSPTLKLALELAAKVTGREDLAALAGQVQELGPLSDETAAETERLAQTLETLTQQQELINQFEASGRALTLLELATCSPGTACRSCAGEQQGAAGSAHQLTDQERLLASEVKQLEQLRSPRRPAIAACMWPFPSRARYPQPRPGTEQTAARTA